MSKSSGTKTYVVDTNVLITSPHSPFAFDEHDVVIIDVTLEELDKLKNVSGATGASAREAIRTLDGLQKQGSLITGVLLPGGGTVRVHSTQNAQGGISFERRDLTNDTVILNCCKSSGFKNPILVTNDVNMRLKAEARGIAAEPYRTEQANPLREQYRGRCVAITSSDAINEFYSSKCLPTSAVISVDGKNDYHFTINEFALLVDECDEKHTALARYDGTNLVPLQWDKYHPYGITPRNVGQKFAQEALMALVSDAPLVILKGPAGTAKTFYSLAVALEKTLGKNPEFERILVTRPNVKFDDDIGYLTGDENEKIGPLMRPIFDNLEQLTKSDNKKDGVRFKSYAQMLFDNGTIVTQAMAFMRGRSISNQIIIVDECQNMTPSQAFGLVSRCGIGSKIILVGDPEQIDNPHLDARTNGLSYASEKMKGSPLCWQVSFDDAECVRSALALEAISRMPPKGTKSNTWN
jgi:PhoH-like ATPase